MWRAAIHFYNFDSVATTVTKMGWKTFFVIALFVNPVFAGAEVYLTKEQALDLVLGTETTRTYLPQTVSADLQRQLRAKNFGATTPTAHFFRAEKAGIITGYALIDSEIGKHLPITYIVGISPVGKVTRVEMMVFREVRGWEVRSRQFMSQFDSKELQDKLHIGGDLRNVSGATLSAQALAKGVKRALFLWQTFFANPH